MEDQADAPAPAPLPPLRRAGAFAIGLFWAVVPLLYDRALRDAYQLPKARAFAFFAVLALGLLVARLLLLRRPLPVPRAGAPLALFLAVAGISAVASANPLVSVSALPGLATLAACFLLGCILLRSRANLRAAFAGLAIQGVVVALVGFGQMHGIQLWEDAIGRILGRTPEIPASLPLWESARSSLGTLFPALGDSRFDFPGRPGVRLFELLPPSVDPPGSLHGHVNVASEMVLAGLVGAAGLLAAGWSGGGALRRFCRRAVLLPAILVQAAFLYQAGSRASWVALAVVSVAGSIPLLRSAVRKRGAIPALGGAAAVLLLSGAVLFVLDSIVQVPGRGGAPPSRPSQRLATIWDFGSGSEAERLVLWRNSLAMAAEKPLLGVGPGLWKLEYPRFARATAVHGHDRFSPGRQPERAHMDLLQILAETGAAGLASFAALLLLCGAGLLRAGRGRGERAAALLVLVAILATSCFAFPLHLPSTASLFFFLLGAGAVAPGAVRPGTGGALMVYVPVLLASGLHLVQLDAMLASGRASWLAFHDREASRHLDVDLSPVGLTRSGLIHRGLDRLDAAIAGNPLDYRLGLDRVRLYWDLGCGDEALRELRRVGSLHPNLVQALLLEAHLRQQRGGPGDWEAAESLLRKALATMPDAPEVRLAQALLLLGKRSGEEDVPDRRRIEARFHLEKACSLREYMPQARILLAGVMLDLGASAAEVLPVLQKAAENASESPDLLARVARAYSDPRLESAAPGILGPGGRRPLGLWRRAFQISRGGHVESEVEIRMAGLAAGELEMDAGTAEAELEDLLAKAAAWQSADPENLRPLRHQGVLLEHLGRPHPALRVWAEILKRLSMKGRETPEGQRMIEEALEASGRLTPLLRPESGR